MAQAKLRNVISENEQPDSSIDGRLRRLGGFAHEMELTVTAEPSGFIIERAVEKQPAKDGFGNHFLQMAAVLFKMI